MNVFFIFWGPSTGTGWSIGSHLKLFPDFLFVIEDRQTGVWLFLGAIENPLLTH
ncbi:hypothetical protein [Paenibacillus jilunlii]|uniref:hypothetical protein n=1 Tax=Paenibacillus jilunlii TaxID=682956 RepID=UPI000AEAEF83|nr:hypothetical protein [Paenibacillus jilunlii]